MLLQRSSKLICNCLGALISPYIELIDDNENLQEKKIQSVRKSKILKKFIRLKKCGFISNEEICENPAEAFQLASDFVKIPTLYNVFLV